MTAGSKMRRVEEVHRSVTVTDGSLYNMLSHTSRGEDEDMMTGHRCDVGHVSRQGHSNVNSLVILWEN